MTRPRVGVLLPLFTADVHRVIQAGREAEDLGFDGVFAFDHLLPFAEGHPDGPALECFTTLAAVGATTSRVAVGSLVARAGLRPAGMLAKMAVTLDQITDGRAVLGLGAGDHWSDRENAMFGLPARQVDDRRRLLGDTALAVKALLNGHAFPGGDALPAMAGPLSPPPVRLGGPPVWLGGASTAVARLAGRVADGWNGWGVGVERFAQLVKVLYEAADAGGRRVEPTWSGIVLMGADQAETEHLASERATRGLPPADVTASVEGVVEHLRRLADAGATWSVLLLAGPPDRRRLFAERVLPALS
jgi:alkanesulfonate monooxygenase SsuD/methylene tetrahydromethanopterin reductase-like flavin-dependent oxidoreductase (luciferase family)